MSMLDLTRPIHRETLQDYARRVGVLENQITSLGTIELARVTMQKKLDSMKLNGPNFKGTRPWNLQPIRPLPEDEVWVGIEYETGFRNLEERNAAYDFVWAAFDGLTIDGEGVGNYYGEFTFSPVAMSTFNADKSDMDDFMRWRERVDSRHPPRANTTGSGIHLNVSTPMIRALDAGYDKDAVLGISARVLSECLGRLSTTECSRLFGRAHPYGYAYNVGAHIEFKLFKTVDKLSGWMEYKPTMRKLVDAVIAVSETVSHDYNALTDSAGDRYHQLSYHGYPRIVSDFTTPLLAYLRGEISQEEFAVTGGRTKAALAAASAAAPKAPRTRARKVA